MSLQEDQGMLQPVEGWYLFDAISRCHLDDDLCSLFVEVAAITTKTNGLALHLIAQ